MEKGGGTKSSVGGAAARSLHQQGRYFKVKRKKTEGTFETEEKKRKKELEGGKERERKRKAT